MKATLNITKQRWHTWTTLHRAKHRSESIKYVREINAERRKASK